MPENAGDIEGQKHCQTFPQGCVGCCVNMRWSRDRVFRYLERNTRSAKEVFGEGRRPTLRDLARHHRARAGLLDHVLAFWMVFPTFGLSAALWKLFLGSCCFAGFIDEPGRRVGCLIHPKRVGEPDLRRHAFPLVPTLGCDRSLRCPMLGDPLTDFSRDAVEASRAGAASLRARGRPPAGRDVPRS